MDISLSRGSSSSLSLISWPILRAQNRGGTWETPKKYLLGERIQGIYNYTLITNNAKIDIIVVKFWSVT